MKWLWPSVLLIEKVNLKREGRTLKKLGWYITGIGFLIILGSLLYPLDIINKSTFLKLILSGAGVMFVGSMIRSFLGNKKI